MVVGVMNRTILIADDEQDVLELVASHLKAAGFQVLRVDNGTDAVELARREKPALAVLDVMMPGLTGFEVCRTLKNNPITEPIPIVLLTARSSQIDRVLAFELGADDYVTKPFSPRELVLRIQGILRRRFAPPGSETLLQAGEITLDRERHEVTIRGRVVDLTAIEFKMLAALLERRDRVLSRDTLLESVWGADHDIEIRTIDTHMRRLREKLGRAGDRICTVRGFGYRLTLQ